MSRVVVFDETGAPEVLRLVDEPAAEPAPGQVRLRIEAIGVNRLDQMMRAGSSPRPISLPHARLGIEATGTIDAVGAGVQALRPGDPVIITAVPDMDTNGTYAESIVLPAERVIPRPGDLDPVAAAALWVGHSTAYGALIDTAGMRPGDSVLITAASSSVGLAAIQIANQIGAMPIAVTRSGPKRERLLAAGGAAVIATDSDDLVATAQALTDGAGVDIIIDSVMGPGLAELASAARPGGTLVAVGWLDPRPASFPMNAPFTIHRYMGFAHILDPLVVRRISAVLTAGIRSGVTAAIIDSTFSLDHVVDAHRHLEDGQQVGKIVLTV